ncbi:hypothetical protein B0T11DRAFT_356560 [Plectosphaerella cucumerina]|uniref:Sm domain-containing protein n=1 Tax=Plectosphaerella cucumerina TaxID=40658 RepID=A0A8K0X0Q4_9PEZI|nr:hypothetical protein B0T11DRAFT_356560 [Plectosphaerella cucumerina]
MHRPRKLEATLSNINTIAATSVLPLATHNTDKMLPLGLLNAAQGHPMLVELKNGETLNGHLVMCDTWMNLTLKEVVQTSPEGDKFVKIPEVYVKGNNIKYLRVPDDIIDIVKENQQNNPGGFRDVATDPASLAGRSTENLLASLHDLSSRPDGFKPTAAVAEYLVKERGVPLTVDLYQCLVASCRDTAASADMLANLFSDMKELGLPTGMLLCHDALEALAIHPNYLLRNEILWAMDRNWSSLDPAGRCSVALGLLRDGQVEMALDAFEAMARSDAPPFPYLFDIFVLSLTHQGFLDEAIRMAYDKLAVTGKTLPRALWLLLLDICSRDFHASGTQYVWARLPVVDRASIPNGTLLNIINTAARAGDPDMVADASKTLTDRGASLAAHHYEALVDALAARRDVPAALRTLCIMHTALSHVGPASTRSLYTLLRADPSLISPALDALSSLLRDRFVPIAAYNVVLEAAAEARGFTAAYDIYTALPLYTTDRPTVETLIHLLRRCDDARALRLIVSEQPRLALAANPLMFDRAVAEFALAGDLDLVYSCVAMYDDAKGDAWLSRDTVLTVVRSSVDASDDRLWSLIETARERGLDIEAGLSRIIASVERPTPSRKAVTAGRREVLHTDEDPLP